MIDTLINKINSLIENRNFYKKYKNFFDYLRGKGIPYRIKGNKVYVEDNATFYGKSANSIHPSEIKFPDEIVFTKSVIFRDYYYNSNFGNYVVVLGSLHIENSQINFKEIIVHGSVHLSNSGITSEVSIFNTVYIMENKSYLSGKIKITGDLVYQGWENSNAHIRLPTNTVVCENLVFQDKLIVDNFPYTLKILGKVSGNYELVQNSVRFICDE